jgi:hypothetical protein
MASATARSTEEAAHGRVFGEETEMVAAAVEGGGKRQGFGEASLGLKGGETSAVVRCGVVRVRRKSTPPA